MKTAIEWLKNEIDLIEFQDPAAGKLYLEIQPLLEQAKAMEKKQIKDAFFEGKNDGILMERYSDYEHMTPEQYYNETFKSE